MLKDVKIKNIHGKTLIVGRFGSISAAIEFAVIVKIKLRGADLRGADLRGAKLQYANLRGADLQDADLRCAKLQYANLQGADLQDADLRCANLQDADLRGADLDFASMSLCCTSTKMIVDDRFIGQIAYHLTRVDYSNCSEEVKQALKVVEQSVLGNLFLNYRDDLEKV